MISFIGVVQKRQDQSINGWHGESSSLPNPLPLCVLGFYQLLSGGGQQEFMSADDKKALLVLQRSKALFLCLPSLNQSTDIVVCYYTVFTRWRCSEMEGLIGERLAW